jgi:hypothetical protein
MPSFPYFPHSHSHQRDTSYTAPMSSSHPLPPVAFNVESFLNVAAMGTEASSCSSNPVAPHQQSHADPPALASAAVIPALSSVLPPASGDQFDVASWNSYKKYQDILAVVVEVCETEPLEKHNLRFCCEADVLLFFWLITPDENQIALRSIIRQWLCPLITSVASLPHEAEESSSRSAFCSYIITRSMTQYKFFVRARLEIQGPDLYQYFHQDGCSDQLSEVGY